MSLSAAVLDALAEAGASREQIIAAMKADIAERNAAEAARIEAQKEGNRDRQRRKRERDNTKSRDVTHVTHDARDPAPNERDILTPTRIEKTEAKASSKNAEAKPWALPVGVSLQVWTDFLGNRKRKRLGTSPTAWKHFQDDLGRVASQTGIPPPKLIEQCTAKGWGAIYDPRDKGNGQSSSNITSLRGSRPDPALDLLRAARAAEDREADRGAGAALPAIGTG